MDNGNWQTQEINELLTYCPFVNDKGFQVSSHQFYHVLWCPAYVINLAPMSRNTHNNHILRPDKYPVKCKHKKNPVLFLG